MARLAEAERWLAAGAGQLSADEQAFVQASVAARDRELAAKRRWRVGMAAVAAGLLVALGVFATRWVEQYRQRQPIVPEMVAIPPGEFEMGSPMDGPAAEDATFEERPLHTVRFAKGFRIGKYEVTYEEYEHCMKAGVCRQGVGTGREPVTMVSWDDARKYAQWLSDETGARYRLPTEAEWEYAARGGSTTRFWWGNDAETNRANCDGCGEGLGDRAVRVGRFPANPFGLHDTAGNVTEWVQDCYFSYEETPRDGSSEEETPKDGRVWLPQRCFRRVARGGSWRSLPPWVRSAHRYAIAPDDRDVDLGCRLAQDSP